MTVLSISQKNKLAELFKNNKFSELEFEIENISNLEDRSAFLSNMLGVVKLKKTSVNSKDFEDAQILFKDAYHKDPNYIDALCNYGHISLKLRNFDYVFNELKNFIKNKGYDKKVYETLARIYFFNGEINKALELYKEMVDKNGLSKESSAHFLTSLNYSSEFSQLEYLNYCKKINERFKPTDLANLIKYNFVDSPKNLEIGFISPDFCDHAVTQFLFDTLKELKKYNLNLHAFNLRATHQLDNVSDSLRSLFDNWHDLNDLSDLQSANVIRKNKINILINLVGYFARNRFTIMKYKPAPVQAVWMGYINTLGIEEVDYIITDPYLIKDNEYNLYSETIIKLPNIWNCHSAIKDEVKVSKLPASKNKHITFGCFNNSTKISDQTIKVWSQILVRNKDSKLIIKAPSDDAEISQKNILQKFKNFDVDTSRIIFASRKKERSNHYKMYNEIDISLDTFPYPGVTTSIESIWMGVPVLTMKGNNFVSRCGESININLGMPEFIAIDQDDYIKKAVSFSENFGKLSKIRKTIREKALNSPLFNMVDFGKNFSDALRDMWSRYSLK